jgi:hypothetical protein
MATNHGSIVNSILRGRGDVMITKSGNAREAVAKGVWPNNG